MISNEAVKAAVLAIHRVTCDDEFTHEEANTLARAALEAGAPYMTPEIQS